jgi:uncharacterized protein DUF4412
MTPTASRNISPRAWAQRGRAAIFGASCVAFGACNGSSATPAPAGSGTPPAVSSGVAGTSTGTTPAPSVVDRALTFLSGGPFEGDITMSITHEGKPPIVSVFEVKGEKVRFNMASPRPEVSYSIVDFGTKQMMAVSDAKQTVMLMSMDGMGAMANVGAPKKPFHPVATGKTDVVAGYSCEVYRVDSDEEKDEACVSKGIHFPQMEPGANRWLADIGDNVFPLRSVRTDAAGKEKSRMEVTKIEKKSLNDSVFAAPPGYKTMNMEDMMKGRGSH